MSDRRNAIDRVTELERALAAAERELDKLHAGLERLTRLYEDEHELCERPMWLQELIARPTRRPLVAVHGGTEDGD